MVALSRVKNTDRGYLGDDFTIVNFLVELVLVLNGDFLLLVVFVKDRRSVLGALVVALLVERRRVVGLPVDFQQLGKRDDLGIKLDLNDLSMARRPRADFLIGRILGLATGVTRDDLFNPFDPLKYSFGAPEASAAKGCFFQFSFLGCRRWS